MSMTINDIPELENNMSFMMGLAYKQFRTLANQVLAAEWDITLEMLGALRVLAHRGEIPQQALAEALHRERSVTKRLVDNCIKRGLVVARKSETNKKARYLALTEQGQETKTQAHQRLQAIVADYYAPLSADEQRLLLSLCKKLIKDDVIIGAD